MTRLAFVGAALIDGTGVPLLPSATILLEDNLAERAVDLEDSLS
jgi:hypothetical protein